MIILIFYNFHLFLCFFMIRIIFNITKITTCNNLTRGMLSIIIIIFFIFFVCLGTRENYFERLIVAFLKKIIFYLLFVITFLIDNKVFIFFLFFIFFINFSHCVLKNVFIFKAYINRLRIRIQFLIPLI